MEKLTRACPDCGADITHRHRNSKRCELCAEAQDRFRQSQQAPPRGTCLVDDEECVTGRLRKGYCSKHYSRQKRYGAPVLPPRVDHFTRYHVTSAECWEWTGPLYETGYGHSPVSTGSRMAHRAFYMRLLGPIPDGLHLDHLCRNRICVNPEHLEPVTQQVNIQRGWDAVLAGRCRNDLHDVLVDADWYIDPSTGARRCRACWRISYRKARQAYIRRHSAAA